MYAEIGNVCEIDVDDNIHMGGGQHGSVAKADSTHPGSLGSIPSAGTKHGSWLPLPDRIDIRWVYKVKFPLQLHLMYK